MVEPAVVGSIVKTEPQNIQLSKLKKQTTKGTKIHEEKLENIEFIAEAQRKPTKKLN
jgi:hypothetical protein